MRTGLGIQNDNGLVMGSGAGAEIASKQARASFRGDRNVLKLNCGNGGITL